jgi:hypothetical protein
VVAIAAFLLSRPSPTPRQAEASIIPPTSAAGTPMPAQVQEDFEDGIIEGWRLDWGQPFTVIDDGTGNHVWRSPGGGHMVYQPSANWRDYAVEMRYNVVDWADNATGIVFGLRRSPSGACRRYDFVLHPASLSVGAAENDCYDFNFFKETDHTSAPGVWNTIYIEVRGTQLQWRLNGGTAQRYEDSRLSEGRLSILNFNNSEVWFDDLKMWQFE